MIGVDPAPRLLEVARRRASDDALLVDFRPGEAASIPLPDNCVDAIVSVFAIIFAPDPEAAAAEVVRVLRPGGRLVLAAWTPVDAPADPAPLRREALAELGYEQTDAGGFPRHDPEALDGLFAQLDVTIEVQQHLLAITDASPRAYAEADLASHPLWVEARAVLEAVGRWEPLRNRVVQLQSQVNEDPAAFRVTCPYVIASATSPGEGLPSLGRAGTPCRFFTGNSFRVMPLRA